MKTNRRMFLNAGVAAFAVLLPFGRAAEHLTPADYTEVAGIYSWLIEIPTDIVDGAFLTTRWSYPSVGGRPSERGETGLSFEDVPAGTTAKLFLWFEPWLQQKGKGMDGIRFCVKYREKGRKSKKRYGILKVPQGYIDLHAVAPSGERTDNSWIVMMTNPNNDPEQSSVFLDFDYGLSDTGAPAHKIDGGEQNAAGQPAARPESE